MRREGSAALLAYALVACAPVAAAPRIPIDGSISREDALVRVADAVADAGLAVAGTDADAGAVTTAWIDSKQGDAFSEMQLRFEVRLTEAAIDTVPHFRSRLRTQAQMAFGGAGDTSWQPAKSSLSRGEEALRARLRAALERRFAEP